MTTYIPFTPSLISAPQFTPTLDGAQYNVVVTWSLFGQRYYLNCYSLNGERIFTAPLIESAAGVAIESLKWDVTTSLVTAKTTAPHGLRLGAAINLTIAGCAPDAYNGAVQAMVASPTTFTYPLQSDPGTASVFGSASYLISMTSGYFTSTLVYRDGAFEVSP